MGLLQTLGLAPRIAPAAPVRRRRSTRIASPFSSSSLEQVVWSDVFGDPNLLPLTRKEAMSVPAIARGRHLIVSTLSRHPLRELAGATPTPTQPLWLYRSDSGTSPMMRLAYTVDDLIFYGWSLWAVERGATSSENRLGPILDAAHVPYDDWDTDDDGRVTIYGSPLRDGTFLLFEGLHEGVLGFASDSIRTAKKLERTVANKASNPTPTTELHYTGDDELTDDEEDALVAAYAQARHDPNGAVTFTPRGVELKLHGQAAGELLIEGRNASAVDMARVLGLPASLIDATGIAASLTYETTQGRNAEFVDYTLALYSTPIEARLSLDDCTPRGKRVAFDLTDLRAAQPSPTGPTLED